MKLVIRSFGAVLMLMLLSYCKTPDKKPATNTTAPKNIYGNLPNIVLIPEEGQFYSALTLPGNAVIIFFAPDCDHCQRQAAGIQAHLSAFRKYKLYFISMDTFQAMHKFAADYKIDKEPNVLFLRAEVNSVTEALGSVSTPTICIYDENKNLVKRFDGETSMEEILPLL